MEPEPRRPLGRTVVAVLVALLGAVQVVAILVWLVRNPEPDARMLVAVPWLLASYSIALVGARAARRGDRLGDPGT
jgi:hypothetical protein